MTFLEQGGAQVGASSPGARDFGQVELKTKMLRGGDQQRHALRIGNHHGGLERAVQFLEHTFRIVADPGYLRIQLGPAEAVQAGGGWRLQGDASYASAGDFTEEVFSTNAVVVQFAPINGWKRHQQCG
jgi:hypothetical protein